LTNTKWILALANGERLVMRWADPDAWGSVGREHVRREGVACRLLAGSTLPVPELLASDPDGGWAGGPANLLTWLPGRPRLDRLATPAIAALARLAVAVHRQAVPTTDQPPAFVMRGPGQPEVPGWARWPNLWRRAINLARASAPSTPQGLLHRDFHLGNTLWREDEVTGLVDWAETCWGPPDLDVAHLCWDFAMMHAPLAAEVFRSAYLKAGGRLDPDPDAARFWMISDILGFLPDPAHILPAVQSSRPDLSAERIRHGLEGLLAQALEQ